MRQRPTDEAHPAELVQRAPELWLKEHDDADQDRRRRVAKDPREQVQVEKVREQPDQRQQQDTKHQLDRLGTPNQQENPVDQEGDDADVHEIADVSPDVPALQEYQDVAQDDVHQATSSILQAPRSVTVLAGITPGELARLDGCNYLRSSP